VADVRVLDSSGTVVAEVEGLTFKRASPRAIQRAAFARTDAWLHHVAWRTTEGVPASRRAVTWLVLADEGGLAGRIKRHLEAIGCRCPVVYRRAQDGMGPEDHALTGPNAKLLGAIVSAEIGRGSKPPLRVISLRALNGPPLGDAAVDARSLLGPQVDEWLETVGALTSLPVPPRLWLVTGRGQSVRDGDACDPVQSALWGFAASLAWEHPELWGGVADVTPDVSVETLCAALDCEGEDRLAIRGSQCFVPRLEPLVGVKPAGVAPITAEGTYLVTGGLGGIGLAVAGWLADRGARHVVLASRRRPDDESRGALERLTSRGVDVRAESVDVGDAGALGALLRKIASTMPPLRGVFHAAGVLDDGLIAQQAWGRFERVLSPKALGAWNLHRLTRDIPLDHFVCFSSVASVLGSPGQSNYASANAFLDGLVHHRRAGGLPALGINWGPWNDVGMAARLERTESGRLKRDGVGWIQPSDGVEMLDRLLAGPAGQATVFPVQWDAFMRSWPAAVPGLLSTRVQAPTKRDAGPSPDGAQLMLELERMPAGDRADALATYLRKQVAHVLGSDPSEVDPRRGLFDMGFDSLMAMELKNRLQQLLGRSIAATVLFEHPDIEDLSRFLAETIWGAESSAVPAPPVPRTPSEVDADIAAAVSHMSDEEVERMLKQMSSAE
jgi:aryl carrier-like protein